MKAPPIQRQLFGPKAAALYLGVCLRTVYNLRYRGTLLPDVEIPSRIEGKTRRLYSKARLDAFVVEHRVWVPNGAAA